MIVNKIILFLILISFSACSLLTKHNTQVASGFLGDQEVYDLMQSNTQNYGKSWKDPNFQLSKYSKLIFPRVRVWLSSEGEKQNVSPEELNSLATAFRNKVIANISDKYPIVQTPTSEALIINLAITEASPSVQTSSIFGSKAGEVAIEGEILDSISGQRLAIFMDQKAYPKNTDSRWSAVEAGFDTWAHLIRQRLDQSRNK